MGPPRIIQCDKRKSWRIHLAIYSPFFAHTYTSSYSRFFIFRRTTSFQLPISFQLRVIICGSYQCHKGRGGRTQLTEAERGLPGPHQGLMSCQDLSRYAIEERRSVVLIWLSATTIEKAWRQDKMKIRRRTRLTDRAIKKAWRQDKVRGRTRLLHEESNKRRAIGGHY